MLHGKTPYPNMIATEQDCRPTVDRDRQIVNLVRESLSYGRAATEYGITVQRVRQICADACLPTVRQMKRDRMAAEIRTLIVDENMSVEDVAARFEMTTANVRLICKSYDIPLSGKRKKRSTKALAIYAAIVQSEPGITFADIARDHGVTRSAVDSVYAQAKRLGLDVGKWQ